LKILLMILFAFAVVSCGNDPNLKRIEKASNSESYELITESYIDREMKINYPQIINLSDGDKQKRINNIIKNKAYGYLENDTEEENNEYSLDIDYHVTWKSSNLLSIQYSGYSYYKGAAHPVDQFYTTNIDLNKETTLRLIDLVAIDENFVKEFKNGKLQSSIVDKEYILEEYSNQEWIDILSGADDTSEISSYLTKDSLGISLEISHAVGDHVEFEINYQDISSNIKAENEVWKDFSGLLPTG
jgi:hypothetical protein